AYFLEKDVSDFEWVMWFTKFRNYILLVLSGHVLFGKIVSMVVPEYRALIYMTYGLLTVLALMGYQFVLLLVSHCFVLYTVALIKCRWLCFIAGLGSLASLKLVPFSSWQMDFALGNHQLQDVLYAGGLAFTIIRCMSFMLDNCDLVETNYSFLDLLKYNFYLPFFFFGPIMIYEDFHKQVDHLVASRESDIRGSMIFYLVLICFIDCTFHYLYIVAIPENLQLLDSISDWGVAFLAYSNLLYDWVKAAVLFGMVGSVARLDHFDPPKPPKCITALYVFADTYIYNYVGESHTELFKELRATISTFAVTTLWLGPCPTVCLWSACNCFGLNLELWIRRIACISFIWSRRIRAMFGAANYWNIILYNVLSINSVPFAELAASRLFFHGKCMLWLDLTQYKHAGKTT
uniref:Hedgehog acyltransferase like, b n=1 Tax=Eptatretus burgeri TaxID=7764 RepID=A0A8C4NC09_EPTBU